MRKTGITSLRKSIRRSRIALKSEEKILWSEASAHLHAPSSFAWRNEVMHPKETYTEEQANEVFSHVKAFAIDMVGVLK